MECFTVYADEIEGRVDPHFYRPSFIRFDKRIRSIKYEVKEVKDFSKVICGPFGSSIKVKDYRDSGVPLVRISNVDENQYLSKENTIFITEELAQKLKSYKVKKGDLIISQRGTLGLIVKISDFFDGGVISANFIAIKNLKGILPDYLKIFISSQYGQVQLVRKTSGQVQTKITTDDIKSLIIPILPLKTQNHIVQIMDDAYKTKKQKETEAQQLLDLINDYVLEELGIKFPELKDEMCYVVTAGEVKNNRCDAYYYQPKFKEVEETIERGKYEVKPIGELFFIVKDNFNKNKLLDQEVKGFIEIGSIKNETGEIIEKNVRTVSKDEYINNAKKAILTGDILISTRRPYLRGISIVPEGYNNQVATTFFSVLRRKSEKINPYYVFVLLRTNSYINRISRDLTVTTYPVTNDESISNIKIPIPPLEIQNKIAEELKVRMQKAKQLQKEAKEVLKEAKERVERIILGEEEI